MIINNSCKNSRKNQDDINFNKRKAINILLLILLFNFVLSKENKIRKLNSFKYEINLTIKGPGEYNFLSKDFLYEPSVIYINGDKIEQEAFTYFFTGNTSNVINNVTLRWNYTFSNFSNMFQNVMSMTTINFFNFNNRNITNMENMFLGCIFLESINFNDFDTSQVTNMARLFKLCTNLKSLDIPNFNTSSVVNMEGMFMYCYKLTSLNLSHFDTSNVFNMKDMFNQCKKLRFLKIDNFNISSVTEINAMFYNCTELTSLDLSNFRTSFVNNTNNMFNGCAKLQFLDISNFDTSLVKDMNKMFCGCKILASLNLKSFNTKSVTDMRDMFNDCNSLISLNLKNFYTTKVTLMDAMFYGCNNLISLNVENFDTTNVISMSSMFMNCQSLTSLNLSSFNTPRLTNMNNMFQDCKSLKFINLNNFNTSKVTNMKDIFNSCSSLISLNLYSFVTSSATKMDAILYGCESLIYLNLINFDTSSITTNGYSSMFDNYNSKLVYCINGTKVKNEILSQLSNAYKDCSNTCFSNPNIKFIIEKNTCIDKCSNDNNYQYEYGNLCYYSCPEGTHNSFDIKFLCEKDLECDNYYNYNHTECLDYILEGYYLNESHYKTIYKCDIKCQNCTHESTEKDQCLSCNNNLDYYPKLNDESNYGNFVNCYSNLSEGFYLENNIYKSCYETCKKCTELGDINNHKCIQCYQNYTLNETNCYKICQYYYYFDLSNQHHCTEKEECPEHYKLIIDKNKCINKCSEDGIYKIEYKGKCYQFCPNGTYYNYNLTECIDSIPEGFYCNDTSLKTIDKCDNKCKSCSYQSMKDGLCISCNINENYYPKYNPLSTTDFFECFNKLDGYFLNKTTKFLEPCYKTCKSCENLGDNYEHKCTDCYSNYYLNNSNCLEKCKFYYYYDLLNEYHCSEKNECPTGYKKIGEKMECILNCSDDGDYRYEYKDSCYQSCPEGTIYSDFGYLCEKITQENCLYVNKNNECIKECNGVNFINNQCKINNNENITINDTIDSNAKDNLIKDIEKELMNGTLNSLIENITKGDKSDLVIKEKDISYQITTTENQNKNEYNNISLIQLGECETTLRKIYNISKNLSLIIFKIDYYKENSLIPIIGYEVFHPINKSKLNLSFCKEQVVNFKIPVTIDENNLFKYDPNNEYYEDECIPYTTENGTDILINDRQNEYNINNLSICESNCTLIEYDLEIKKSICECYQKTQQIIISEIISQSDILYNNFEKKEQTTNMISMKCYYTLFTKEGIYKNLGNYILLFTSLSFIISGVLFYKFGFYFLEETISNLLKGKNKNNKKNILNKKKKSVVNIKKKSLKAPPKKNLKKVNKNTKLENFTKDMSTSNNLKSFAKLNLKNNDFVFKEKNIVNNYNENQDLSKLHNFTDFDLNCMSYTNALKYDKRSLFKYYFSLIRTKQILIFTFCPMEDYNSKIIKMNLFLISFIMYYFSNTLFFNESTIHKIYEDGGIYNFSYQIPYILYSFIISHTLNTIIRYFSLSERNIYEIKIENEYNKASLKVYEVKKYLTIKYILFYLIGTIFLLFSWYYLSSFCAVFQNTQFYIIKNTLICFGFSLIYPFIINLLPGILRIISLKETNRKCLFINSKILEFL